MPLIAAGCAQRCGQMTEGEYSRRLRGWHLVPKKSAEAATATSVPHAGNECSTQAGIR
jgi:hypothetical protein